MFPQPSHTTLADTNQPSREGRNLSLAFPVLHIATATATVLGFVPVNYCCALNGGELHFHLQLLTAAAVAIVGHQGFSFPSSLGFGNL